MTGSQKALLGLAKVVLIGGPIVLVIVLILPAVVDHLIASYWDKRR